MIKQEIIEKISRYFKLTQFEAEKIYEDIFSFIMQGVKDDNIVDLTNFGEFIIKYNNGKEGDSSSGYRKTIEFLATSKLEEDINDVPVSEKPIETQQITQTQQTQAVTETTEIKKQEIINETPTVTAGNTGQDDMEDEIKRKREEVLSKINKPDEQEYQRKYSKTLDESRIVPPVVFPKVQPIESKKEEETKPQTEELSKQTEPGEIKKSEEIKAEVTPEQTTKAADDLSQKSFSDFFTEVKSEQTAAKVNEPEKPVEHSAEQHTEHVIPKSAVELHNQITSPEKASAYPVLEAPSSITHTGGGNGSGNGNGNGNGYEHRLDDNSYYIWYKDTEASATETQTLSYEYELLYQATKEAEYQSKLKIYVTTFIVFFSIVLILLIFSPVIYKVFFKTPEVPKTETVPEDNSQNNIQNQDNTAPQNSQSSQQTDQNQTQQQNAQQNSFQQNINQTDQNNTQQSEKPAEQTQNQQTTQQQNTQQQSTQQQSQQQQNTQQQTSQQQTSQQQTTQQEQKTQNNDQSLPGVTKNSMGYMDEKLKVIYVQLENGKFTIQESAWDSDAKANKRISTVQGFGIKGLNGSILKVDLADKGTWYRARFGEFSTLQEAKSKAEELRNKERIKLQAFLLTFLMYG